MTVAELLHELENIDPDAEVRLAVQPRWPFEYSVREVAVVEVNSPKNEDKVTVYLAEGEQLGYLPGNVKDALGW